MSINFANNNSLSAITTKPSGLSGGSMNLISTQTASSSSTISFTSGIDSTYKEYIFKFYNLHPSGSSGAGGDGAQFQFQANASGGSGYNETITSTFFRAQHDEADSATSLAYEAARDQAQGTSFQDIHGQNSNDSDHGTCGTLHLFDPSNTTFVKHFISRLSGTSSGNYERDDYCAGYFNTTSSIDEIQFKFSSGNIDSGTIKLYGIS